jgi:hypothetical protein
MPEKDLQKEITDLKAEVKRLKKSRQYGLVWEHKPEDIVLESNENIPILKEIKGKKVFIDGSVPNNFLIEGDNYHALAVLNYTHRRQFDVVYIDPPYNTGARDWKYNNDFVDINDEYRHSKWLSLMANRLVLAKNLLKEDGLNISKDIHFIRTTDDYHKDSAKAFWIKVRENGYIYKKNYKIKYCIGCELEKTDSELIDGKCPLHPLQELELIEEENYFFKFSAFQDKLLNLYRDKDGFVIPDSRYKEIKSFVEKGLEDFSISRLKEKMPW